MILGTAGHIDHGKTALVRALTGVDTDRLPEEKRRGITIELGFAPLDLGGVGRVGVVDVPGHEAFVRTMVAGSTGIDVAVLVIAANEGVMPQTTEHLAVLGLLDVRKCVVALTKCDLVEEEWLALVESDVRSMLEATPFNSAPIVSVSAHTGQGLDELRNALSRTFADTTPRPTDDLFRMPVDRAFAVKGSGTVITGPVWSGQLESDASVQLLPSNRTVRVKGLHVHGAQVERVRAGERAAIALAGLDLADVHRGDVVVQGSGWRAHHILRGDVSLVDGVEHSITPRTRVQFHHGTSEVSARVVMQTGTSMARIVLDTPVVARGGDHFILRAGSPLGTIGGGTILDPHAPARAKPLSLPERSEGSSFPPADRLTQIAEEAGTEGIIVSDIAVRIGVLPGDVSAIIGESACLTIGDRVLGPAVFSRLETQAHDTLANHHQIHPLENDVSLQWLRSKLGGPDQVVRDVIESLCKRGDAVAVHERIRLATHVRAGTPQQARLKASLVALVRNGGESPPSTSELAAALQTPEASLAPILEWAVREGELTMLTPQLPVTDTVLRGLLARLLAGMAVNRAYTPAELRDVTGLTRRLLIPLLEYCDREGYTIRGELGRRLAAHET